MLAQKVADAAAEKRAQARDADWGKLASLLDYDVVPAPDKGRWAAQFGNARWAAPGTDGQWVASKPTTTLPDMDTSRFGRQAPTAPPPII